MFDGSSKVNLMVYIQKASLMKVYVGHGTYRWIRFEGNTAQNDMK